MALYYFDAQIISRADGRSAVAAAAYRAGEKLYDHRYGKVHDYSRKSGIAHSEILLPDGAPAWMSERQELWNQIEVNVEKHPRAQLCRELTLALQSELSIEQNLELLRGFLQERFVSRGMVVDLAIHYPLANDDDGIGTCINPHAHVMQVLRVVEGNQFGNKLQGKAADFRAELLAERERWAQHVNAALAKAGVEPRVDHRSLAEQGSNRLPQLHLGVHASAMEKRGISTEKGKRLAAIQQFNRQLAEAKPDREAATDDSTVSTEVGQDTGTHRPVTLVETVTAVEPENGAEDLKQVVPQFVSKPEAVMVTHKGGEDGEKLESGGAIFASSPVEPEQQIECAPSDEATTPSAAPQRSTPPTPTGTTPAPISSKADLDPRLLRQASWVSQFLHTVIHPSPQNPQRYDLSVLERNYKVEFDDAGRLTLTRVADGKTVIDQGQPTSFWRQADWQFFQTWKAKLTQLRHQQQKRAAQPSSLSAPPSQQSVSQTNAAQVPSEVQAPPSSMAQQYQVRYEAVVSAIQEKINKMEAKLGKVLTSEERDYLVALQLLRDKTAPAEVIKLLSQSPASQFKRQTQGDEAMVHYIQLTLQAVRTQLSKQEQNHQTKGSKHRSQAEER